MTTTTLTWKETALREGRPRWIVYADTGTGPEEVARGGNVAEVLETAMERLGFTIFDRADWPPCKIAHFPSCGNLVRNIAVLCTGLQSLYEEAKGLEAGLPQGIHDGVVRRSLMQCHKPATAQEHDPIGKRRPSVEEIPLD